MIPSLRNLRVRSRDQLTPALWNRLLTAIEARTPRRGIDVLMRSTSSGIIVSGRGSGRRGVVSHPWRMEAADSEAAAGVLGAVRFERGLVAGLEATIAGKPMSAADQTTGELPALVLREEDFGADGLARIYARATFKGLDFTLESVSLVARPATPLAEAWTAYKLIGFAQLARSESTGDDGGETAKSIGSLEQMCFFNLSLAVSAKKAGAGTATYWWAAS